MKLGLKRGEVRLVPYQPAWRALFAAEKQRLVDLLGDAAIQIEHVGSTAVPGLLAKPVIDMAIAVHAIEDIARWPAVLAPEGYAYFGDREGRGDYFFAKGPDECRSFYLHVVLRQSQRWIDYLHFRDALRADASLREEYAGLKNRLCAAHAHDRAGYTSGKDALIRRVLQDRPNKALPTGSGHG
jgi:GrpB-like predicted nucleotidyltransferase (UPF0157 family)